jgi:hypothetical protein
MFEKHFTIKCDHCGSLVARLHKNNNRVIVPIFGSSIVRSEVGIETIFAKSMHDTTQDTVIIKTQVKCGKEDCGKKTTFTNKIEDMSRWDD